MLRGAEPLPEPVRAHENVLSVWGICTEFFIRWPRQVVHVKGFATGLNFGAGTTASGVCFGRLHSNMLARALATFALTNPLTSCHTAANCGRLRCFTACGSGPGGALRGIAPSVRRWRHLGLGRRPVCHRLIHACSSPGESCPRSSCAPMLGDGCLQDANRPPQALHVCPGLTLAAFAKQEDRDNMLHAWRPTLSAAGARRFVAVEVLGAVSYDDLGSRALLATGSSSVCPYACAPALGFLTPYPPAPRTIPSFIPQGPLDTTPPL